MNNLAETLIPIFLFGFVTYAIKFLSDNSVRKKAIESGLVDEKLIYLARATAGTFLPNSLKWGIILMCVGIAFFLSHFLPAENNEQLTAALVFGMAGTGLIVYYFLGKKMFVAEDKNSES